MFHLKTKNIADEPHQMNCLITVVAMVLYLTKTEKLKKKDKKTHLKVNLLAITCKEILQCNS